MGKKIAASRSRKENRQSHSLLARWRQMRTSKGVLDNKKTTEAPSADCLVAIPGPKVHQKHNGSKKIDAYTQECRNRPLRLQSPACDTIYINMQELDKSALYKPVSVNLDALPGIIKPLNPVESTANRNFETLMTRGCTYTTEQKIQVVRMACERLHNSSGCVVCYARGFSDWRTHKLIGCARDIATSQDPLWSVWRTEYLRAPPKLCAYCYVPQNAIGGWHTYRKGSLCLPCCPTPDIVKPVVYALAADPELFQVFHKTDVFREFPLRCYKLSDYATWLLHKQTADSLSNILEAFLWLVTCRSAQAGFNLD